MGSVDTEHVIVCCRIFLVSFGPLNVYEMIHMTPLAIFGIAILMDLWFVYFGIDLSFWQLHLNCSHCPKTDRHAKRRQDVKVLVSTPPWKMNISPTISGRKSSIFQALIFQGTFVNGFGGSHWSRIESARPRCGCVSSRSFSDCRDVAGA